MAWVASWAVFPSMKARQLLAVLVRPPLRYRVVRQTGSHRQLRSTAGYPPLTFAWQDAVSGPATVIMEYHHEPEGWWADSDDLPGFTAVGATLDEVRELAHSGAEFYLQRSVEVEDRLPNPHQAGPTTRS
jgi:predicted RNase H-like HicB family nuclease